MLIKCNEIISETTKKVLNDSPWLKKGKVYTVLAVFYSAKDGISAFIQSENFNEPVFTSLDGFEIISQKQPESWITKIKKVYNIDVMTRLPKSWDYENFFEDLDNENPDTIELFRQEAIKIYDDEGYPDMADKK